jgi:hypothetical protein
VSILVRFNNPPSPVSTDQYDAVISQLQNDGGDFPPEGLDYHCAFNTSEGFRVSEVWDSREKFDAFGPRLMPILAEQGIDPGEPEILEVYNVIKR